MRTLIASVVCLFLYATAGFAQTHPVTFTTAGREVVWAQMKTDYDANPASPTTWGGKWYKYIVDYAVVDTAGVANTFLYHVSGTAAYATAAYSRITTTYLNVSDATLCSSDFVRGRGWSEVWKYDWLYPALSAGERTAFLNRLNTQAQCMTNAEQRTNDTDHQITHYYMVALLRAVTGDYNSTVVTFWNDAANKLGGYDATGTNARTSRRDALKRWITLFSAGGEFVEGSRYNLYMGRNIFLPAEGIRTATGTDSYPEVTAILPDFATSELHHLTPTMSEPYEWGDSDTPRSLNNLYRVENIQVLAGLSVGTAAGQRLQNFLHEFFNLTGPFGSGDNSSGMKPTPLSALVWNPYATESDYTTAVKYNYGTGAGIYLERTGWGTDAEYFGASFPRYVGTQDDAISPETGEATQNTRVHHELSTQGGIVFWKNGKWALAQPLGYGGPNVDSRGTNSISFAGLPVVYNDFAEYKNDNALYRVDADFTYLVGTQGGSAPVSGRYAGLPPIYLHEHTRSIVWLKAQDVIVVYDRTNVKDPVALGLSRYSSSLQAYMASSVTDGLKTLRVHIPTASPTITSNYVDWQYGSTTERMRVTSLLPLDLDKTIQNETVVWGAGTYQAGYWTTGERKYHVAVIPQADRQWDTFLTIYHAYAATSAATVLVQDATNRVDGSLITSGLNQTLLAFNATQGPDLASAPLSANNYGYFVAANDDILDTVRFRDTSYSLTFDAGTLATKVILCDLDPETVWTYTINAEGSNALTVDSNGIGNFMTATTGAVTLAVIAGGAAPDPPVVVGTASLPNGALTQAYSQPLSASGGNNGPYTWSITAGSLPDSLSLSGGGTISGTPTVAAAFNFTARACDSTSECGTRALSITVVSTPSLSGTYDNGTVGTSYSDGISLVGGTAPFVYTLTSGALCNGLGLAAGTGVISGTPTLVEVCEFEVTITDDVSLTDTEAFRVSVGSVAVLLSGLSVRSEPSHNAVVVHMSTLGLQSTDACHVDIMEGDTVVYTNTTTVGRALRSVSFTGLLPDKLYGVDTVCGEVHSLRTYFRTTSVPADATTVWSIGFTPHSSLIARGVERVSVTASNEEGGADVTVSSQACLPSCTVSLTLERGVRYSIFYSWLDSVDGQIASSRIGMLVAVP